MVVKHPWWRWGAPMDHTRVWAAPCADPQVSNFLALIGTPCPWIVCVDVGHGHQRLSQIPPGTAQQWTSTHPADACERTDAAVFFSLRFPDGDRCCCCCCCSGRWFRRFSHPLPSRVTPPCRPPCPPPGRPPRCGTPANRVCCPLAFPAALQAMVGLRQD